MNKICILSAGRGTRNNNVSGLHKALLPIENKPVISHIFDKLDKNIEIVIAVGYKSNQIKSYIKNVHSDRNVSFVDVDNYDKIGSGPGYSLLCCKSKLQEPFVLTSVDTLIGDDIDFMNINSNWLGTSCVDIEDSLNYCLINGSKYLDNFYYGTGDKAYIGLAGIYNYKEYWEALQEHNIIKDEYQVIHGFDGIKNIKLIDFVWYDTGNNKAYEKVKKVFNNEVVANKSDEVLFIDNGYVVKYFNNSEIINLRINRTKYLNGNCPKVTLVNENMYRYDYIKGEMLSNITDESIMRQFLDNCQEKLFVRQNVDRNTFINNCKQMYEDKTNSRISSMFGSSLDKIIRINGIEVEPISDMLNKIDWNSLYENAISSYFHGDLQPENILYDGLNNKFVLIDWRQRFGESLEIGDIYYDLGKLHHDILINGQSILKDMFDYTINGNTASVEFYAKSNLVYFMNIFREFCDENNYCWNIIELHSILQYINICTLYTNFKGGRYGDFLFLYGKYLLAKHLNKA
jgi:GTP:adenosylcobinamide-phosphate guanylyltransferase|tara:strand:- start:593 stop:2140 length:1548 start_codon:yes stop_codon:yes gene_type:complete